jgi:hypothetical protein
MIKVHIPIEISAVLKQQIKLLYATNVHNNIAHTIPIGYNTNCSLFDNNIV